MLDSDREGEVKDAQQRWNNQQYNFPDQANIEGAKAQVKVLALDGKRQLLHCKKN